MVYGDWIAAMERAKRVMPDDAQSLPLTAREKAESVLMKLVSGTQICLVQTVPLHGEVRS